MKTMLRVLFCCLIFTGTAIAAASPADDIASPETVVARLETTLIENMKAGDSMTFEDRFDTLRPLLDEIMAVGRMGRYLFGRDWASFEPAQRKTFQQTFLELTGVGIRRRILRPGGGPAPERGSRRGQAPAHDRQRQADRVRLPDDARRRAMADRHHHHRRGQRPGDQAHPVPAHAR